MRQGLEDGSSHLVVGTHALLEDAVVFGRLGLAIIDEQHRFGVAQRQAMLAKGAAPHLLVMTATPIPRSLALSLYGDLDVSVIDEMPPGRTPVRTVLRDDGARARLAEFLRKEVAAGGQAYWVFPLIEESEKVSARAVATHVRAVRQALTGVRVEAIHGRTPAAERDAVMAAFTAGEVGVLCATTVIEVGVDVPNASVMVIENAERFGLAQLHQLRGRVGRGRRRSFCVLLVGARVLGGGEAPPRSGRRHERRVPHRRGGLPAARARRADRPAAVGTAGVPGGEPVGASARARGRPGSRRDGRTAGRARGAGGPHRRSRRRRTGRADRLTAAAAARPGGGAGSDSG